MYVKKIKLINKEVNVYKSKENGFIYFEYIQLLDLINLKNYYKYYENKVREKNLILDFELDNKKIKLVNTKDIIKLTNIFKNIRDEKVKEEFLNKRKGLSTKAKKEMKSLLPIEVINILKDNKIEDYFMDVLETNYLNRYELLKNNLYSLNIDKLSIKKRILKVSKIRKRKDFTKTRGELIVVTLEKDIALEKLNIYRGRETKLNRLVKKLENEKDSLNNTIKSLEPEFHYFISSNFLFSYNRALKANNNRIICDDKYKTWKKDLADKIRKLSYTRYLIKDQIFNYKDTNYILIDMNIYMLEKYCNKDNKITSDIDNYYKCIQDVISLALGINDKYFKINSLKFIPVKDVSMQGYQFGLRKM